MRKVNRIISAFLSVAFLFNNTNFDTVIKAVSENAQETEKSEVTEAETKISEETAAESSVSETEGISGITVSEAAGEITETSSAETSAVTSVTGVSGTAETTAVSETSLTLVTEPDNKDNETAVDPLSSDTSGIVFKSENTFESDTEIDSAPKTEYSKNTLVKGNLTIKSGTELHVKQGVVIEVQGDLIIEEGAALNVSEGKIKTVVKGNVVIKGKMHYTDSTVVIEGNLTEEGNSEIQGNGTVVLTGGKQQYVDTHSRIYRLVNKNTSGEPLAFAGSLNFETYEDNGNGIITFKKNDKGEYTEEADTVKVKDRLTFWNSGASEKEQELIIYGGLCIADNVDINISNDPSAKVTLRIKGDYTQEGGHFKTAGQKMAVEGDLVLNGGTFEVMNAGSEVNVSGNMTLQNESVLVMTQSDTKIITDGNFTVRNTKANNLKNGIIEVKGDFTEEGNGDNFRLIDAEENIAKEKLPEVNNHKVILNGTGKQKISFETPTLIGSDNSVKARNAQFATLKITKYLEEYEVTNDLSSERIFEYLDEPQRDADDAFQFNNGEPYRIRRNLNTPLSDFELIYINGYIHALGGTDESGAVRNEILRYDINKNKWENDGSLNTGRADYASAAVNNTIYVTGGFDGKNVLDSMEAVSTDGKSETVKLAEGNSLIARKSHKAVYYNGKVYIMGGENKDGEVLNTLEVFDPEKKTVEVKAPMNTSRKNFGATLYLDGDKFYIIAAGGENSDGILKSVEVYDPETDTWTAKPDMNVPRKEFGLEYIMGKLLAVGGVTAESENGAEYAESAEGFDGEKWITLKDAAGENVVPSEKRGNFGSVAAYNSIFIAGGETPAKSDTFEQFMPLDIPAVRFKGNSKGLNGDFTQEETDIAFNGPLSDFSLDRVFNSQFIDEASDFLGFGWKFRFESSLKKIKNCAGKVNISYLNVRETPQGRIVGGVEKGTVLEVTGTTKDGYGQPWYEISAGSGKYYVYAEYVDVDEKNKDAVAVTYPDGMKGYFTGNDKDGYHANFGTYDKIVFTDENTCELTTKEQVKYVYTKDSSDIYRNTLITDRYGNTVKINYTYDSEKKSGKIEVTGCNGDKITVTRSGEEVSATDNYGRKVIYKLNEAGDLAEVTDAAGLKKTYEYSGKNIVKVTETSENGTITLCKVEYDKSGRIFKYTDADGNESFNYYEDVYMDENNKAAGIAGDLRRCVVDPKGGETVTKYSLVEKRPVKVIDAAQGVATYKYEIFYKDKFVDVTNLKDSDELYETYKEIIKGQYPTRETVTDSNSQTTVIEKDERGNVTKKTNPDGSITEYKFDGKNNLVEEICKSGETVLRSTKYSYDESETFLKSVEYGNKGSKETYAYDDSNSVKGLVKTKETVRSDEKTVKTEYSYYDDGRLKSEKTGDRVTDYGYCFGFSDSTPEVDVNGKKVALEKPNNSYEKGIFYVQAKRNPNGNYEITYHDRKYAPVKTVISDASGKERSTSLFVYDKSGRKIREVKPEVYAAAPDMADTLTSPCHTYKYSGSGLLTEETDDEGNTTYYEYDKAGNLVKQTEPGGAVYTYEYDALNRLITKKYSDGTNSALLESFSYERGGTADKASKQTHTEYIDSVNKLVTETFFDYAGRETVSETQYKRTEKEYYADGNLKRERVFDKAADSKCISDVVYFYNDRGMPDITLTGYKPGESYFITKNLYTKDGLSEYEIVYTDAQKVDPSSPVIPEKAKASVTRYEYDESGNVLKESSLLDEFAIADLSSAKFAVKTEWEYDVTNNTVTEKSGKIKTVYVNNYLDKTVTVKNIADSADITGTDGKGETELITLNSYDRNGNLIKTVTPSGSVTEYRYDNLNRLTETIQNNVPSEDGGDSTGTLTETLSYNWAGSVTKKILKFGDQVKSESAYYYDSRNNMILSVDKTGDSEAAHAYEYNNAGLVTAEASPESFAGTEEEDPLSRYTVSNAYGYIKYTYDNAGRLKNKKYKGRTYRFDDETGTMNALADAFVIKAYEYDANDNVIRETEGEEYAKSEARSRTFIYSGTNELISEKSPECDREYSVLYEYDALGNIILEKSLKGTAGAEKYEVTTTDCTQGADGITVFTQKTFEGEGENISSASPLLSVKSWKTDINGNTIEESVGKNTVKTEYNSLGFESRSVTETDRYTENGSEKAVNSEIKTVYDKEGNPAVIIHNSGITEIREYDCLRRVVSETKGKRPEGVSDNKLKASDLTESVTHKWTYDAKGNVRYEYDGNGFRTEYEYDELDRLTNTVKRYGKERVSENKKSYDLDGNLTEEITLLDGKQTGKKSYVYDGLGRVVQKSDADVPYEYIEYNRNSDQIKSYDAEKVLKTFEYDADRRLVRTNHAGVCIEELQYDYAGNVNRKTDGEGNAAVYCYDVMDRLVKVSSSAKDSEKETETASYTYNAEGNIATKTAGSRNKITYQYTASNQIKETNTNGRTEKFFYDTDGNLARSVDPAGNETVYTYTVQGFTAKEEVKSGDKVAVSKTYTYDKNGNVLKSSVKENGKENIIVRSYDELGRVTKKEATGSVTSEFVYDMFTEDGLLYEVNRYSNGESSSNVYDGFGRLKYVYSTDISKGADAAKCTEYTYDEKGRRTGITYPNGAKSEYTYFDNNDLKTLTNSVNDKVTETYEYSYFKNNTMSGKKETIDGVKKGETSYGYDELGRLVTITETGKENRNITYSYDDSGNRIKEESLENNIKETTNYSYGEGDLLLGYTVTTGDRKTDEVKYEYDKNGNLTKEFVLVKNGAACSDKDKPKTVNTYDVLNQLVSTQTEDFTVNNEYNAEGLRISKEVKTEGIDTPSKTNYTYEYDKVVFETDAENPDNNVWNVHGINLVSKKISGEMFYCMYNGHADITAMISENGETAEKYYYDEWGKETETSKYGDITGDGKVTVNDYSLLKKHLYIEPLELTSDQKKAADLNADGKVDTSDLNTLKQILFGEKKYCEADTNRDGFINEKNSIKYAGYYYDAETGLYYLNARFYDPETARFIQQDSYSGNIYDPLSLNLYTYSNNNPISYYDPTGHSVKSVFKKAVNSVKKAYNTAKTAVTVVKPVVKQNVKANTAAVVNTVVKKVTAPLANTIKAAANKTEKKRETFQTVLDVGKSVQSPVVNAWANYAQGEYDTLAGQINGFMEFSDNPAQTIENSVNYFLSDPLRNNPATALGMYYYEVGKASNVHDWNTVSYKLGVGAVNLSEFYAGAKIGSKMPEIKASAAKMTNNIARNLSEAKSSALSKLGSYADDFSMQSPVMAGGIRAGAEKSIFNSSYKSSSYYYSNREISTNSIANVAKVKTGAFSSDLKFNGNGLGKLANKELHVSEKGLNIVKNHIGQFEAYQPNIDMIERLEQAMIKGEKIKSADASFYMHELAESHMMKSLLKTTDFENAYDIAHSAALKKYDVSQFSVYHPEVIAKNSEQFSLAWRRFWEVNK
ncbi:MAG: hypothetical protein IJL67_08055 [Oscillospiraceae bacterium]|nr:hypothetical protein [Oscillospiraceae bacterium]